MSALDNSIVNSILPILTRDFQTDVATIEWIVTTYLLVQTGVTLSFGRLGDMPDTGGSTCGASSSHRGLGALRAGALALVPGRLAGDPGGRRRR